MAHLRSRRGKKRYVGTVMVKGKRKEKWFPDASKKSQRAAAAWETENQELLMEEESQTVMESLTIKKWVNAYMDDVLRRQMSKKTYAEKRSAFIGFVQEAYGDENQAVDRIDRYLAKRHLDMLVDSGHSGYSVNKVRKNLGAAWKWGSEHLPDWPETHNPFHALQKYPEQRSPRYIPPADDFWKFTDYLETRAQAGDPAEVQDYVMHQVFLHLAARKGEVFRIKKKDLDFDQNRIRLWTRKRKGGQLESDWLPMPSELKSGLLRWLGIRMQLPVRTDHVFICVDKNAAHRDYYLGQFEARRAFMQHTCEKAKVTKFGYHAIRHFTASHLYTKGYPVSVIQAILRHTSPNTTARYLHSLGLDPAIKEALEDGITRPAKVIHLDQKKILDVVNG